MKYLLSSIAILLCLCGIAFGQDQPDGNTAYWRGTVIEETLSFSYRNQSVQVPAIFEKIVVEGSQRVADIPFPFEGLMLVQLRAGELETMISNDRKERQLGEFWVVQPGERMEIQTEDDKAILAIYLIGAEYLKLIGRKSMVSNSIHAEATYRSVSKGLFAREAYLVGDRRSPIARVLDFNVGPGRTTEDYRFDGAALIQVSSGGAQFIVDGKERDAQLGDGLGVSEGQSFVIDNRQSDQPFKFRALVWHK